MDLNAEREQRNRISEDRLVAAISKSNDRIHNQQCTINDLQTIKNNWSVNDDEYLNESNAKTKRLAELLTSLSTRKI